MPEGTNLLQHREEFLRSVSNSDCTRSWFYPVSRIDLFMKVAFVTVGGEGGGPSVGGMTTGLYLEPKLSVRGDLLP